MNKSAWILGLVILVMGVAMAQRPAKPKRLAPVSAQTDLSPVTRAEARAVIVRIESLLNKGLGLPIPSTKIGIPEASTSASRGEIVHEFYRLFTEYKPSFKFTPAKVKFDSAMLTLKPTSEKPALEKLIAWGTVAKLGPVAAGSTPGLTIHQFGDAVGFFVARIADLAHLPPSRWTPYLNGGHG